MDVECLDNDDHIYHLYNNKLIFNTNSLCNINLKYICNKCKKITQNNVNIDIGINKLLGIINTN